MTECGEAGRVSTAHASAHYRTRIHDTRLMLGERRCLSADYRAIAGGREIVRATWRTYGGYVAIMSDARISSDGLSTSVTLTANWIGDASIRCEATMDDGSVYAQVYRIDVSGDPIYLPAQTTTGPLELTVEVEQ